MTKETETEEYVDTEIVNALIEKEEFGLYIDKNVKATLEGGSPLAHIQKVVK